MTSPLSTPEAAALRVQVADFRRQIYAAGELVSDSGRATKLWPAGMDQPAADALRDLVIRHRASRTLEVGLGLALSSLAMVEGLLAVASPDAQHVTIDPDPQWCDFAAVQTLDRSGARRLTRLLVEPSHLALPRLLSEGGRPFDVALIDGGHWYDYVSLDLFYALRLVRPAGLIVIDDHWMPAIQTALAHAITNYSVTLELFDPAGPARRLVAFENPWQGERRAWDDFEPFSRADLPAYPWRTAQRRGAPMST